MLSAALLLPLLAAFTGLASAQNYSTSGPISVVPDSVPYPTRISWCSGQTGTCNNICNNAWDTNSCNPDNLTYACTCANGPTPNISDYQTTLPFFICQTWIGDCVDAHPNDIVGQQACRSLQCGTKNATASNTAPSGTGSGSTPSNTNTMQTSASQTAAQTSSTSSPTSSPNAAILNVGVNYGTGILSAAILAMFGLAL